MILGVLNEVHDTRVALVPQVAQKIADKLNAQVIIESGAGDDACYFDEAYVDVGAKPLSRQEVLQQADIVITINVLPDEDLKQIASGKIVMALFRPYNDATIADKLRDMGLSAFSLDMFPRTTLAQNLDVQSSQASVAGYQAVLLAAHYLPVYFPMLITAAGSIPPAKVLVLGTGVAGLQAIATANRLGAKVEAYDVRKATKEEVESLGAKFIHVDGSAEDAASGGYAIEQTEDFQKRQKEIIHERAIKADVIICTARLRGKPAPRLIMADTVQAMKKGAVIIDLASDTGGNCELTEDNQTKRINGVTIVGDPYPERRMPKDSSLLFSNNIYNFLAMIIKDGALEIDEEHEFIKSTLITQKA